MKPIYTEAELDELDEDEDEDLEDGVNGVRGPEKTAPVYMLRRRGPKIGRNDPCLCGSGQKYKRCCWGIQ